MPQIVLDGTGKPKSDIVEGAYELCGLNGFEFDRTPEEMTTGLRMLNDLMSELAADGLELGYDFPTYGNGLLEEPSGLPDSVIAAVKKLLAQMLCPALGATFSEDARASLNRSWFSLRGRMAGTPPSMKPAYLMKTNASRRRGGCLGLGLGSTTETPVVVPPVTPVPTPDPDPDPVVTLVALLLSASTVAEGAAPGTVVGTLSGMTAGSTLSLSNDAGGRFALSGNNVVTGLVATDYETASFHNIEVTETLSGAIGSPKPTSFTITVTNALEVTLAALGGTFTLPEDASAGAVAGAITGKSAGSTLSLTNDAGGRVALSGTSIIRGATALDYEIATSHSFTVRETHSDATNSPRDTVLSLSVTDVAESSSTISAPVLGYPSPLASNPTTISFAPPVDWITGDVVKLARSASPTMSSPTILSKTITDADLAGTSISIGLSGVTLSGVTYFQAYGARSGADSVNKSNVVAWGDTTAPLITNTAVVGAPGQNVETTKLWDPLTVTETGSGVPAAVSNGTTPGFFIYGGPDQLLFEIAVVGGVAGIRWMGDGSQSYSAPLDQGGDRLHDVTVGAIDRSGNLGTKALQYQVTMADTTPDAFSFTDVTGATASTVYTSNTVTIAGLGSGINAPISITGGTYSKNGGSYTSASGTVQNGDTVSVRTTSSASGGVTVNAVLTIGTASDTYSVTTTGVSAAWDSTINSTEMDYTANSGKTVANTSVNGDRMVASVATISTTDKKYFEFVYTAKPGNSGFGVVGANGVMSGAWAGGQVGATEYDTLGNIWHNNANSGAQGAGGKATAAAGDRFSAHVSGPDNKVWFAKWNGSAFVEQTGTTGGAGTGLSLTGLTWPVRAMGAPGAIGDQHTLAAAAGDQLGSPASGFTRLA